MYKKFLIDGDIIIGVNSVGGSVGVSNGDLDALCKILLGPFLPRSGVKRNSIILS